MKFLIAIITLLISTSITNAQSVELLLPKTEWSKSEKVSFTIKSSPEILLEVAVFSEDKVVLHQNARLNNEAPFELDMKDYAADKYYILITGDDVHIQKDFTLKE